jgi:hypothetical protein
MGELPEAGPATGQGIMTFREHERDEPRPEALPTRTSAGSDAARPDGTRPWYSLDPVQARRITAALDRYDQRKNLEAEHAGIGLRFIPPVLGDMSDTSTWRAVWDGGQASAGSDAQIYAIVCERLNMAG